MSNEMGYDFSDVEVGPEVERVAELDFDNESDRVPVCLGGKNYCTECGGVKSDQNGSGLCVKCVQKKLHRLSY